MREKYFTAFIFWIIIKTNLSCVQIFGLHFFKLTKHRVVPTFFIDHVLNLLTQVSSYKMLQVYYLSIYVIYLYHHTFLFIRYGNTFVNILSFSTLSVPLFSIVLPFYPLSLQSLNLTPN